MWLGVLYLCWSEMMDAMTIKKRPQDTYSEKLEKLKLSFQINALQAETLKIAKRDGLYSKETYAREYQKYHDATIWNRAQYEALGLDKK